MPYYECDDGGCCVLRVEIDDEYPQVYLAIYEHDWRRSLRNRVRHAWAALMGRPFDDQIILSRSSVTALACELSMFLDLWPKEKDDAVEEG